MKNKYLNGAHISERKFREILKYFSEEETASKTARYSGLNRNTVNRLFKLMRQRIVEISVASTPELGEFEVDEPTAAIDAIAEANIFDRIYKFIENKTVIIISHRFSTVRSADKVIVLSEGEIQEQGSHEELMANKGMYYEMFTTQAKGYV